ncbi:MAG: dihydroorotase [Paraprevotella sp.]|nr:dihydroorotase [Paraprevotella sp.]
MKTRIENATLINEGQRFIGTITIEDDKIMSILPASDTTHAIPEADSVIDAEGLYLIPGVIDEHVHFREPGLTHKADIASESRAAAAGGVTSYMDMPNVIPQTTALEALEAKWKLGAEKSLVNYSFFFGATHTNADLLERLDPRRVCGVKLFMGSSTGNMLVDRAESLHDIFARSPLLIMTHCEDSTLISARLKACRERYGDDPDVCHHAEIRNEEVCFRSTELAVQLAHETGARLHVAHVSTARELSLFSTAPLQDNAGCLNGKSVTAEACIAHLLYTEADYARLGTRIKCNPAIKTEADRTALRRALTDGHIDTVATDHAPHLWSEKEGGCVKAASGMPMVQFSLVSMLKRADEGVLSMERVVELMCHTPARLFQIQGRGFLREGAQADLVLLRPSTPWTLRLCDILSKCGWSPLEGETFNWAVERTYCNGHLVYHHGQIHADSRGQQIIFNR